MLLVSSLILLPVFTGLFAWRASLKIAEKIHLIGSFLLLLTGSLLIWEVYQNEVLRYFVDFVYVDALSAWLILMIIIIGFLAAVYSHGYLREEQKHSDLLEVNYKRYYLFFHLFLATMLFVAINNNLGMIWIGIELTTLVSAMLVAHEKTGGAIEAAWKYLIIGSVGIAFALLGVILLYTAGEKVLGENINALNWSALLNVKSGFDYNLLKYAFVFIFLGFGTKAGLAPMHFWLPDAHSQAPTPVSALLSGVLLNTAIYGILRVYAVVHPFVPIINNWFIILGTFTILIAVPFILIQKDIKRLLAYSSVEHVGIIIFGIGLGNHLALYGSLLHMLNHALSKTLLFFTAGNIVVKYHTKLIGRILGMYRYLPITGIIFLISLLAITGSPPFNMFISEFHILLGGFQAGNLISTTLALSSIVLIFAGMLFYGSMMIFAGSDLYERRSNKLVELKENKWMIIPMFILVGLVLFFGIYIPTPINTIIERILLILQRGA